MGETQIPHHHTATHIRPVKDEEILTVTQSMARAFSRDALNLRLFGNAETIVRRLAGIYQLTARRRANRGYFFVTDDLKAGILCVPPHAPRPDFLQKVRYICGIAAILRTKFLPLRPMFQALNVLRPPEPHLYIQVLCVDPTVQGQGRGRMLLGHVCSICDQQGWMAYLECAAGLVIYYERHGFAVRNQRWIPELGLTLVSMHRPAAGSN